MITTKKLKKIPLQMQHQVERQEENQRLTGSE
jgi:hypothetical protein